MCPEPSSPWLDRNAAAPGPGCARSFHQRGFTLIEILIAIAIVSILASLAMPSYTAYIQRSRVPAGLDALQSYFTRMEQRFQDSGSYANGTACAVALPSANHYSLTCTLSGGGTGYTATATGSGTLSGYTYTINHTGTRNTTAHPKGVPAGNCWSIRGASCDA
jgi:type IV pilus assembly protein PilE